MGGQFTGLPKGTGLALAQPHMEANAWFRLGNTESGTWALSTCARHTNHRHGHLQSEFG